MAYVNLDQLLPMSKGVPSKITTLISVPQNVMGTRMIGDIEWYPFLVKQEDGRGPAVLDDERNKNKFIVCFQRGESRLYSCFNSSVDFTNEVLARNSSSYPEWCFYEVILGEKPQKIYFDLDMKLEEHEILGAEELCRNLISQVCGGLITVLKSYNVKIQPEKDLMVFSSNGDNVRSYHVVLDNYCVKDKEANLEIIIKVKELMDEGLRKFIDDKVYTSKRQFRLFNSCKHGSNRRKKLESVWYLREEQDWRKIEYSLPHISSCNEETARIARFNTILQRSCVSCTSGCALILVNVPEKKESYGKGDETNLPEEVTKLGLQLIPEDISTVFSVAKIKGNEIILKRKKKAYCVLCNREHESDNALVHIKENGNVFFRCRRDMQKKKYLGSVQNLLNRELMLKNLLSTMTMEIGAEEITCPASRFLRIKDI